MSGSYKFCKTCAVMSDNKPHREHLFHAKTPLAIDSSNCSVTYATAELFNKYPYY